MEISYPVSNYEGLLAQDYISTHANGQTETGAQHIKEVRSGKTKGASIRLENIKVQVFGDAAVVTLTQEANGEQYRFTDTWVKKDGQWQVVANHGSKIKSPKTKP